MIKKGIENIYAIFLLKFKPNKEAKEYLNNLISNKLIYCLEKKFDKSKLVNKSPICKKCGQADTYQKSTKQKMDEMYDEMGERLFDTVDDNIRILLPHRFISKEIKNLIFSTVGYDGYSKRVNRTKNKRNRRTIIRVF